MPNSHGLWRLWFQHLHIWWWACLFQFLLVFDLSKYFSFLFILSEVHYVFNQQAFHIYQEYKKLHQSIGFPFSLLITCHHLCRVSQLQILYSLKGPGHESLIGEMLVKILAIIQMVCILLPLNRARTFHGFLLSTFLDGFIVYRGIGEVVKETYIRKWIIWIKAMR